MMDQENRMGKTQGHQEAKVLQKNVHTTNEKRLTAIDSAIYQTSAQLLRLTSLRVKFEGRANLIRVK